MCERYFRTKALVVIDMQNAVVDGIESADETISNISDLVDSARRHGAPVAWVQHDDQDLPRGSQGWRIVPGLAPHEGDIFIGKQHRSAFAGTGLADALRRAGVEGIVLTGAQSAYYVDMAGKHALAEGFDVTLVSDGHCNGPLSIEGDGHGDELSDAQVRGLVNRTWSSLEHPGRDARILPAAAVSW